MLENDTKISFKGKTYARLIDLNACGAGLNFFSSDDDYIQVGTWNYSKGTKLARHRHLVHDKCSDRTQEAVFVYKGMILAKIYRSNGTLIQSLTVSAGQCIILLNGGHDFEVLEEDTLVLECKNGPYFGPNVDRERY